MASMDGEDYVSGSSLRWRKLVRDAVGSIILLYSFIATEMLSFLYGTVEAAIRLFGEWLGELVFQVVTLPSDGMREAWQTAIRFIDGLGVVALAVAILLVLVVLQLIVETIGGYIGWSG